MPDLELTLKLSRYYCLLMGVLYLGSCLALLWAPLPWWGMLAGFAVISAYAYSIFQQYIAVRGARSVTRLRCTQAGEWYLGFPSGWVAARLRGDSTLSQWLCLLRFDLAGTKKHTVILFRDAVTDEQYRRLLVRIRTS